MADLCMESLRVWLVHDWLTGLRGGEKVLLELVRMFPRARVATLLHVPGATHPQIDERVAKVSFLQKMPGAARHYRNLLPLFPAAIRSLRIDGPCDLVLSVSHAVAKGIRPPPDKPHICYCNTPMRYIWGMGGQYGSWRSPRRWGLGLAGRPLRWFDRRNGGVTKFVANSQNVAGRIERVYQRETEVVYPGVDLDFYRPARDVMREEFYLMVGALVEYKRLDLAIRAFHPAFRAYDAKADGQNDAPRRLVIIGEGPDQTRLRRLAAGAANITLLGHQPDGVVRDHYQRCAAFIFPGEDDFGLTPLEAQACGCPVIAYRAGGALETVVEGRTGMFFGPQTPGALRSALQRFEAGQGAFDGREMREHAAQFTWERFRTGVTRVVAGVLRGVAEPATDPEVLIPGTV